jgi:flotillin
MMAAAAVCGLVLIAVAGRFILVLRPWQAAIVSGMRPRVVTSGRLLRLPVLEQVYLMDLRARLVEWSLDGLASGGVPVTARGYLAFAIRPGASEVERAAEHFLGRSPSEIEQVVRQSVEQAARAVVARLTPDELGRDREKLNAELEGELSGPLEKLGMTALSLGLLETSVAGGRR